MTPIKALLVVDLEVYTEDFAHNRVLVCTAANKAQLDWVTYILKEWNRVPVVTMTVTEFKKTA